MKHFIKKPIETIIIAVLFFEYLFGGNWSGKNIWHKISALLIAVTFYLLIFIIDFTFNKSSNSLHFILLKTLSRSKNNRNFLTYGGKLFLFGLTIMLLVAVFEFVTESLIFAKFPPISVGIPFTIYSFSAGQIIIKGLLYNSVLYMLIIKIIFESIKRK